jgi:hypothetical protein
MTRGLQACLDVREAPAFWGKMELLTENPLETEKVAVNGILAVPVFFFFFYRELNDILCVHILSATLIMRRTIGKVYRYALK